MSVYLKNWIWLMRMNIVGRLDELKMLGVVPQYIRDSR